MIDLLPTEKPKLEDTGSDADDFQPSSIWEPVKQYALMMAIFIPICFAISFIPGRHGGQTFQTLKGHILFAIITPVLIFGWKALLRKN